MLGIFPDPYPDELLLSVCSRYHDRLGYRSRESTGWDLLRANRARIAVDLPSNIDRLISVMPPYHRYTADRIIDENTLYPIYAPFISLERALSLREDMKGSRGGAVHGRAGILTSKVSTGYLRFCPLCVAEDRKEWRETYWHRLHQVPGVEVCPVHHAFLESSGVHTRSTRNREVYVAAERVVRTTPARTLDLSEPDHMTLLRIAQDAAWLLDQRGLTSEPQITRYRYLRLLFEKKLATYTGVVNATKLHDLFLRTYSSDLLKLLHCGLERRINWLRRIVQNSSKGSAQPPLNHLLLMNFLECRAEDFFSLPETRFEPFGQGPWPCLNRASYHFGQLWVMKCVVTRTWGKESSPAGHFHCDCGFVYYRVGPDSAPEDRHQFSKVKSYGDVWYSEVIRMRELEGLTPKEIGPRLGVTHFVIRSQLAKLRSIRLRGEAATQPESSSSKRCIQVKIDLRETFRSQWLKAIRENPGVGRSELGKTGGAYSWLLYHDREWFELNSPPRMKSSGPPKLTDWEKRDVEFAAEARATANRMISAPGRPVRASRTAIARDIGALETIYKRGHLLPLTIKALAEVAETEEAYAIRRIWWAVECYKEEKIMPMAGKLQIRAALSPQMLRRPEVSEAYAEASRSLRKSEMLELLRVS